MERIYLDHNATTPVRKDVRDAVIPFLEEQFGNPSSRHLEGRKVRSAIEKAREVISTTINATPDTIIFNSSATEGNNTVLKGYWQNYKEKKAKNHIIITAVEHPCVLQTARYLEKNGYELTVLPVNKYGSINLEQLESQIRDNTGLISIMMVNNETGNIYPIKEAAQIAHKHNILIHTDAAQAVGKIPVDVIDTDVDFLTMSGHKFYALKGTGATYIKRGRRLEPLLIGGHQEKKRRAGTENIVGIISMGTALEHAAAEIDYDYEHIGRLRDLFESRVLEEITYCNVLGNIDNRIYTTSNISFRFIEGEGILLKLDFDGISVSTGSACSSGSLEASHVITSMKVNPEDAHSSIRFSLGKQTTEKEIHYTVDSLKKIVEQLRSFSPLYDKFINNNEQ